MPNTPRGVPYPALDGSSANNVPADLKALADWLDAAVLIAAQRGAANGVASLDAGGLIPNSQLPPLAVVQNFTVAGQAAMLALTAQPGDLATRTDLGPDVVFMLVATPATTLANWRPLAKHGDAYYTKTDIDTKFGSFINLANGRAWAEGWAVAGGDSDYLAATALFPGGNGHTPHYGLGGVNDGDGYDRVVLSGYWGIYFATGGQLIGRVDAAGFAGGGSNLTNLNASALATGTVPLARLPVAAAGEESATKVVRADDPRLTDAISRLARTYYNPASDTELITNSVSLVDVDATNLSVTFTAPASGSVEVLLHGLSHNYGGGTGDRAYTWGLREGTTVVARAVVLDAPQLGARADARLQVTGLTPGNSYTYKWAHGVGTVTFTGVLRCGNGAVKFGPATMEVHAL